MVSAKAEIDIRWDRAEGSVEGTILGAEEFRMLVARDIPAVAESADSCHSDMDLADNHTLVAEHSAADPDPSGSAQDLQRTTLVRHNDWLVMLAGPNWDVE